MTRLLIAAGLLTDANKVQLDSMGRSSGLTIKTREPGANLPRDILELFGTEHRRCLL